MNRWAQCRGAAGSAPRGTLGYPRHLPRSNRTRQVRNPG
ncbi:hypothetical protein GZL_04661 [Streptomyces sp. 769]|nr:hypothetical protein GZL_04661 [Streptomyces sp. 769]